MLSLKSRIKSDSANVSSGSEIRSPSLLGVLGVVLVLSHGLDLSLLLGDVLALLSVVRLELLNGDLGVLEGEVEEHVGSDWRGTEALDLSDLGVVKLELEVAGDLGVDVAEAISELEALDEVLVLLRCRHTIGMIIGIVILSVAHLDIVLGNGLLGDWLCHHEAPELEVWGVSLHELHLLYPFTEVFDKARPWRHWWRRPGGILLELGSPEWRQALLLGVVDDV